MMCQYHNCNKIAIEGQIYCRRHARENLSRARKRSKDLFQKNLCVAYGLRKAKPGNRCCRKCNKKRKISFHKEQKRRRRAGLCLRCGKCSPFSLYVMCRSCLIKRNKRRRSQDFFIKRARTLVASGHAKLGHRTGPTARELSSILQEIWKSQKGICPLSGRKLTERNAQVDHINPRSKGGKTVKTNLRFLHRDVNQALRCLTDESFIKLCREVINFIGK